MTDNLTIYSCRCLVIWCVCVCVGVLFICVYMFDFVCSHICFQLDVLCS